MYRMFSCLNEYNPSWSPRYSQDNSQKRGEPQKKSHDTIPTALQGTTRRRDDTKQGSLLGRMLGNHVGQNPSIHQLKLQVLYYLYYPPTILHSKRTRIASMYGAHGTQNPNDKSWDWSIDNPNNKTATHVAPILVITIRNAGANVGCVISCRTMPYNAAQLAGMQYTSVQCQ